MVSGEWRDRKVGEKGRGESLQKEEDEQTKVGNRSSAQRARAAGHIGMWNKKGCRAC